MADAIDADRLGRAAARVLDDMKLVRQSERQLNARDLGTKLIAEFEDQGYQVVKLPPP
jgi:hypothetical protein